MRKPKKVKVTLNIFQACFTDSKSEQKWKFMTPNIGTAEAEFRGFMKGFGADSYEILSEEIIKIKYELDPETIMKYGQIINDVETTNDEDVETTNDESGCK